MPAAAAAGMPRSPPVFGTKTHFTFLMMLPLAVTVTRAGSAPSVRRATAAAYAIAIGSVQPIAGRSSSFKTCTQVL